MATLGETIRTPQRVLQEEPRQPTLDSVQPACPFGQTISDDHQIILSVSATVHRHPVWQRKLLRAGGQSDTPPRLPQRCAVSPAILRLALNRSQKFSSPPINARSKVV